MNEEGPEKGIPFSLTIKLDFLSDYLTRDGRNSGELEPHTYIEVTDVLGVDNENSFLDLKVLIKEETIH